LVRDSSAIRQSLRAAVDLTTDPDSILSDPEISIVVELMGGEQPALDYILRAIASGKHVVTANKEVLAKHGPELFEAAAENGVMIRFEASVGGGIPIIAPLMNDLAANDFTAVNAVINGTTNYMLTRMASGPNLDYQTVLDEARAHGYAEADPSADVDGVDAAFKLAILASLAFHTTVRDTDVYREGIRRLSPADFAYAAELGYNVKLLATARRTNGRLQARVHPAFLPEDHPLAKVDGVYNAVELEGGLVDWAMFQGPGAGAEPTASAVLADIVAEARSIANGERLPSPVSVNDGLVVESIDDLETKYYMRLRVYDRPGVLAQITTVFGDLEVSLASFIQKEVGELGDVAEVVITTHVAKESAVQEAVRRLEALDSVSEVANLVRIEERSA
ncbi:MAG: homoserine dehydrogenase, partial [Chloroflexi bacterium]|nr:homoserine dehydrogenase [Chloroflexota bacterium]